MRGASVVLGALCVALAACDRAGRGQANAHGVATDAVAPREVDLAGPWKYLPYDGEGDLAAESVDDRAWPSMLLPSSWYLLGRKTYPSKASAMPPSSEVGDPGELRPSDPDVGLDYAGTVWFRRTFDWNGDPRRPAIVDLDMVDYYATVFLNGVALGSHEGYFQHWSVDGTHALRRGSNVIAVRVSAPALMFDLAQEYPVSWPKMQNQIKGIFAYHDTRPGATSRRGQERSTGGILRGIRVRPSSGVDLAEVVVTPLQVSEASARLVIDATLRNWTATAQAATLDGVIRPSNFAATDAPALPVHVAVTANPGVTHARVELTIAHPHLWWTWDQGRPELYELSARVMAAERVLDERVVRFGVRSITRDDGWTFSLNGRRIYLRGTNYIATQWLSQADREFYARDLRLVLDANLNSIRVHAHLERPEFYDLADEMGVLVWQDFPLQWGYTEAPAFRDEALAQAADMVTQYGNHPSIGLYCMHNESPHAMEWIKKRAPDQNRALDEALTSLVRRLDPSRIVHRDSGTGDGHHYYGWYEGDLEDLATADVEPLVTEYGAASLPNLETLRTMFDETTLWPTTPLAWATWAFADFQRRETFENAKVKRGGDIEELVRNTQRYQAIAVRYTTELLRRRKWQKSTGVYQFMFVDDWPSITWSVLDYFRRPKAAYAALRDAMQRVLPSIEYSPGDPSKRMALFVVNDEPTAFARAHVAWRVIAPGGSEESGNREVDIPADAVLKVADLAPVPAIAAGHARLEVTIESGDGQRLGRAELTALDFLDRGK